MRKKIPRHEARSMLSAVGLPQHRISKILNRADDNLMVSTALVARTMHGEPEPALPLDDDEKKELQRKKKEADRGRNGKKKSKKMKSKKKKTNQASIDARLSRLEKEAARAEGSEVEEKLSAVAGVWNKQLQARGKSVVNVLDPHEAEIEQNVISALSNDVDYKLVATVSGYKQMVRAMKKASRAAKGAA